LPMSTHTEVARRLAANSNSDEHSRPLRGSNMSFQPRTGSKPAAILGYGWAYYALRVDDTVILIRHGMGTRRLRRSTYAHT
jgi:hypothetical protein